MKKLFVRYTLSLALIFIVGISVLKIFERTFTEKTIKIKITKTESKRIGDNKYLYLIYTKDEVFENRDDNYHRKSNADKLMAKLRKGKTVYVIVVGYKFGFHIPFISDRRNIIDVVKKMPI